MAKVIQCDRCQATEALDQLGAAPEQWRGITYHDGKKAVRKEFCPSCVEALDRFMLMRQWEVWTWEWRPEIKRYGWGRKIEAERI